MTNLALLDTLSGPWITGLANGIWESSLLAATTAAILAAARRSNATTRYALWFAALTATIAISIANLPITAVQSNLQPTNLERRVANQTLLPTAEGRGSFTPISSSAGAMSLVEARSTPYVEKAHVSHIAKPIQIQINWLPLSIAVVWTFTSLLMLGRLMIGIWMLAKIKRGALSAPLVYRLRLAQLASDCGLRRPVQLAVTPDLRTPVATGLWRPFVLIPKPLLEKLTAAEFDQIVVHELAHIQRWDDWVNFIQQLIGAVFVFHPAVRFINRQLSMQREIACDDAVIARTGNPRQYAECLTRLVEITGWKPQSALAPGAALRKSQIGRRIESLLDSAHNADLIFAKRWAIPLLTVLCLLTWCTGRLPALWAFTKPVPPIAQPVSVSKAAPSLASVMPSPAMPAQPAMIAMAAPTGAAGQAFTSFWSSNNNNHITIRWTRHSRNFEVDMNGRVEFTDDDHDIKSLSPDGAFRMDEQGSPDRKYEVNADGSGRLLKTYSEDGRPVPINDAGRQWLASRMPEVIRETGIGASERVRRILQKQGPAVVFSEIGLIHSDGSKRVYLQEYLLHGNPKEAQLSEAMRLASTIASDGEKQELLSSVAPLYLKENLRPEFFDVINTIASDGEHARIITAVVNDDPGDRESLMLAARSAARIASDGEKAQVLISIADHYQGDVGTRSAWFAAVNSIASDGEKHRALSAIVSRAGADRYTLVEVMKSAATIASAGEKASLLIESAPHYTEDPVIRRYFFIAVDSIASDGEKHKVLSAISRNGNLGTPTLQQIFRSAKAISSDGEKSGLLSETAALLSTNTALQDDYFSACATISSDGEHAQVLLRVLDGASLSSSLLLRVIDSATHISSNGEKANVLARVIRLNPKDDAVRSALRKSISTVQSDGEYRRLTTALGIG